MNYFENLDDVHKVHQFVQHFSTDLQNKLIKTNVSNEKDQEQLQNVGKFLEEYKIIVEKFQDLRPGDRRWGKDINNILYASTIAAVLQQHQAYLDRAYEIFIGSFSDKELKEQFAGYYQNFQHVHESLKSIEARYHENDKSAILQEDKNYNITYSYEILSLLQEKYAYYARDLKPQIERITDIKNLVPSQVLEVLDVGKDYVNLLAETIKESNNSISILASYPVAVEEQESIIFDDAENGYFCYKPDHSHAVTSLNQSAKLEDSQMMNFKVETNPFIAAGFLNAPFLALTFGLPKIAMDAVLDLDAQSMSLGNDATVGPTRLNDIDLVNLKMTKLSEAQPENSALTVQCKNEAGYAAPTQAYAVTLFNLSK